MGLGRGPALPHDPNILRPRAARGAGTSLCAHRPRAPPARTARAHRPCAPPARHTLLQVNSCGPHLSLAGALAALTRRWLCPVQTGCLIARP